MKNLHVLVILAVITIAGLMLPITPLQANGPMTTTDCYHIFNGVPDQTPYTSFTGPGSCPDYTQIEKNLANIPPHQCYEVGVTEDYL